MYAFDTQEILQKFAYENWISIRTHIQYSVTFSDEGFNFLHEQLHKIQLQFKKNIFDL